MQLDVLENISLKNYNTFGVEANAAFFFEVSEPEQLTGLYEHPSYQDTPKLVLGGGSNILFTQNYAGLVVHIAIPGISEFKTSNAIHIRSGAGVRWHDLVRYCVIRGYGGIENLSLIPGTVGAAPVQNIGAYGVELKDVFYSCKAFDTEEQQWRLFTKEDCAFGYRESIFKKKENKGRFIITEVELCLPIDSAINTSYGAIQSELARREIVHPTISDVSEVVCDIRVAKLPDPSTIGNSGSFFKNPIIDFSFFRHLQSKFVDIVHYRLDKHKVKIAAGWLIEQCGWKGVRYGNTGTWKNQALVLVNNGNATGSEVYVFSEQIIASVYEKFEIELQREVNVV